MDGIFLFLSFSTSVKLAFSYLYGKKRPKNAEYVGEISEIFFYPVKSTRSLSLQSVECLNRGLKYPNMDVFDRNYVMVNGEGRPLYPSSNARVTLINTKIEDDNVVLYAEGMGSVKVPTYIPTDMTKVTTVKVLGEDVEGQDCGDEVGEWISNVVGEKGCRLKYGSKNIKQRILNQQTDKWKKPAKDEDIITFQNSFPVMLASHSSLLDFNSRISEPVEMDRFRPNLVISGSKPFDEDNWQELWIGNMKFTHIKPCKRCPSTLAVPQTGKKDPREEPLKTLRTFRLVKHHFGISPLFGINLVLDTPKDVINVGDPVYILRGKVF